jgi:hypothetical protein
VASVAFHVCRVVLNRWLEGGVLAACTLDADIEYERPLVFMSISVTGGPLPELIVVQFQASNKELDSRWHDVYNVHVYGHEHCLQLFVPFGSTAHRLPIRTIAELFRSPAVRV